MTGYDPGGDRNTGAHALPGAGAEPARGTEAVGAHSGGETARHARTGVDRSEGHEQPPVTPAKVLAWICLALPFIALLWIGSYAKAEPRLAGFPFFFWYQLAWVFLGSALTLVAYLVYSREDAERRRRRTASREEGEL